jgi:hypothetical protein
MSLIIGRESIKQNDLVTKLPRFFFDTIKSKEIENENRLTHFRILPCECDTISKPAANDSIPNIPITPSTSLDSHHHRVKSIKRRVHFDDTPLIGRVLATLTPPNDALNQTHSLLSEVPEELEQFSRAELIGADEIDDDSKEMFNPFLPWETSTDAKELSH